MWSYTNKGVQILGLQSWLPNFVVLFDTKCGPTLSLSNQAQKHVDGGTLQWTSKQYVKESTATCAFLHGTDTWIGFNHISLQLMSNFFSP